MSELVKRTLSGAGYVAVVVGVLLGAPSFMPNILCVLALLAAREYHMLRGNMKEGQLLPAYVLAVGLAPLEHLGLLASFVLLGAAMIYELWRKAEDPIRNWGDMLIAEGMIGLPFYCMARLCDQNPLVLLAIFVIIWSNDTLAYVAGSTTAKLPNGNHKMFPRVSPKKSWEGLAGGLVGAVIAGLVFSHFVPDYTPTTWVLLSLLIGIAGTLGDLMESLLKRTIGVKDSGVFLPGHGGVLDRFDSILLAAPVVYLIVQYL